LASTLRIARIEIPKDNGLSVLLLDVVGDILIEATVRRAEEFGLDAEDLYKRLVKSLNLDVDLSKAD
jgi:hypothetical protein